MKITLKQLNLLNKEQPKPLAIEIGGIYTSTDKLPADIPKPQKSPYLILKIPFNAKDRDTANPIYYSLQLYGMGTLDVSGSEEEKSFLYIVTGKRKVKEVIAKLRNDNKEDISWLSHMKEQMNKFDQTIAVPQYKQPTARSVSFTDLKEESEIDQPPLDDSGSHPVKRVTYKDRNFVYKEDETGRQISEIEAFNAMCYRLLLGSKTPEVYSVHDGNGNRRKGTISEEIPGFETVIGRLITKDPPLPDEKVVTREKLVNLQIGRIAAAAYAEAENDCNLRNIGFGMDELLYVIDPGQASYPIAAKYFGFDPQKFIASLYQKKSPANGFPITKKDSNNLPVISDMDANQFLFASTYPQVNEQLKNEEKFIEDKFYTLLKRILIEDEVYTRFAKLCIRSEKSQKMLADHKIARTKLLKNSLLTNPQFIQFYETNKEDLAKEIIADFTEYNILAELKNDHQDKDEEVNETLVDIADITKNFENLLSPTQALADFNNQYNSALYITKNEKNAARALYLQLNSSLPLTEEVGAIARRSCHLMDVYQRTCADIKANEAEKNQYVKNFITYCKGYEDQLPLSLGKKVFMCACTFGGALLGTVLGLVAGAAVGLAAGAAIGGGAGSVVPVFGNAVGAIGAGSILGVVGAIKAAGTAAIVGTAIGAAAGGALLGYGGGKAGYLSRYGIFNTKQKATQRFSKAFQEGIKNEPEWQNRKKASL